MDDATWSLEVAMQLAIQRKNIALVRAVLALGLNPWHPYQSDHGWLPLSPIEQVELSGWDAGGLEMSNACRSLHQHSAVEPLRTIH